MDRVDRLCVLDGDGDDDATAAVLARGVEAEGVEHVLVEVRLQYQRRLTGGVLDVAVGRLVRVQTDDRLVELGRGVEVRHHQ
nr:hypothetical protein [Halomarina sp. PSRA2]